MNLLKQYFIIICMVINIHNDEAEIHTRMKVKYDRQMEGIHDDAR